MHLEALDARTAAKTRMKTKLREMAQVRLAEIERMFKDSTTIELAFLLDGTGSMYKYISAAADQVISIATLAHEKFDASAEQVSTTDVCSTHRLADCTPECLCASLPH